MTTCTRRQLAESGQIASPHGGQPLLYGNFARYRTEVAAFMRSYPSFGPSEHVREVLAAAAAPSAQAERPSLVRERKRLIAGAPLLRISHQPNILAALNIVGLAVLAAEIRTTAARETGIAPVVVYIANDYDVAGDRRFKASVVPGWSSDRMLALTGAVAKCDFGRPAALAPPPPEELFDRWRCTIEQSARFWWPLISDHDGETPHHEIAARSRAIMTRLGAAAGATNSASGAGTAMLDNILNAVLGLEVLCVSEASLIPVLAAELQEQLATAGSEEIDSWVWRICPTCLDCCHVEPTAGALGRWRCEACDLDGTERIDFTLRLEEEGRVCPAFLPRILLQDRMDQLIYRAVGGIAYAGSAHHLLTSRCAMGSTELLTPEYAWEPTGLFRGARSPAITSMGNIERGRCAFPFYAGCVESPATLIAEILRTTTPEA